MASWHGFMSFLSEAIWSGSQPHPAYAPQDITQLPGDARTWAEDVYLAQRTPARLIIETYEDLQTAREMRAEHRAFAGQEADDEDDEDDALERDDVLRVTVEDDGTLHIYHDGDTAPSHTLTARQVFETYGMPFPETTP